VREHNGLALIANPETLATVPVPIRGARRMLADHGLTLGHAARTGRLIRIGTLLCTGCGHAYETRSLGPSPFAGCGPATVALLAVGVVVALRWSVFWGFVAGLGAAFLSLVAADRLCRVRLRRRYTARAAAVQTSPRCPKCGAAGVPPKAGMRIPCRACGAPVRLHCTRISRRT
jgi:hypothetical protein